MEEEMTEQEEVKKIDCPNCGKPFGEGEGCSRCDIYRMAVQENGKVMIMM